jgi:cytidine deaminase
MMKTAGIREWDLDEVNEEDQTLLRAAFSAAEQAYAPHSGFHVGAAARLANGEVVIGSNQENVAFPSGLCAERVAAFAAGAQFPGVTIEAMAIVTTNGEKVESGFSPCGGCRQVLVESEHRQQSPLRLLLQGGREAKVVEVDDCNVLLPMAFHAKGLGRG